VKQDRKSSSDRALRSLTGKSKPESQTRKSNQKVQPEKQTRKANRKGEPEKPTGYFRRIRLPPLSVLIGRRPDAVTTAISLGLRDVFRVASLAVKDSTPI
jgi:hypothetical protein